MVISVGNNGNMMGNIIDADGVRQMRNTAMARSSIVDAILMLMARVLRQMRSMAIVISVGNGNNMLSTINVDGVRQMRNTAMARSSVVDAILKLMAYVKCATRL